MILLQLESGVYFGLNRVGAAVWNSIQTGRTVQDLVSQLSDEYNVSRAVCEREIVALLNEMAAHGLVEFQRSPEAASHGEAA